MAEEAKPLPQAQIDALRKLATCPDQLYTSVMDKIHYWTARKKALEGLNGIYKSQLDSTLLGTLYPPDG